MILSNLFPYIWSTNSLSLSTPQVFTFSQKISVNFQLVLRFVQGLAFLLAVAGVSVAVVLTSLSISDIFACILAFLPTGWGILSVSFLFAYVWIELLGSCLLIILVWSHFLFEQSHADCLRLEACSEENGTMEVNTINCSFIWCYNGDPDLHPYCVIFMVPIRINISNQAYVQPSIQSRSWDLAYPCWEQPEHRYLITQVLYVM